MAHHHKHISTWQVVMLAALIGFAWLYAMAVVVQLPILFADWDYAVASLGLIALGLGVPYLVLKLVMHVAHRINPEERELRLRDIPKDQHQLNRSKR